MVNKDVPIVSCQSISLAFFLPCASTIYFKQTHSALYNLYSHIANNPSRSQRLTCRESLFTVYNCSLTNQFQDLWSHNNYIVYVLEGKKIWHTANGSYELNVG